jgi:hypothetical protein
MTRDSRIRPISVNLHAEFFAERMPDPLLGTGCGVLTHESAAAALTLSTGKAHERPGVLGLQAPLASKYDLVVLLQARRTHMENSSERYRR